MSDYFITNIAGVVSTGSYGPDGKPLNINNDGGIEITPQDAGNVPSASTEPREGIGNDKSISANAYNQSASSTDTPAPVGNPNLGNRARPDAQNLIRSQQRNAPSDNPFEETPYATGSYDWYKNESPAGSITPVYRSSMNIDEDKINEEGDTIGNYPYTDGFTFASPPVDTPRGGTTTTITYTLGGNTTTQGTFGVTSPFAANRTDCRFTGPSLFPCEIATCTDSRVPFSDKIGKELRIFQGSGCSGEYPNHSLISGYWMEMAFTGQMDLPAGEPWQDYGTNCESFEYRSTLRFQDLSYWKILGLEKENSSPRLTPVNSGRALGCNCVRGLQEVMGIDGSGFYGKAFGHNLMYVGTSLADVKNSGWCGAGREGITNWFLEGSRCNSDGTRNDVFNSGKLFGACCTGAGEVFTKEVVYELTEVDSIVINSSDDPCDCRRRKIEGAKFLPEWTSANTCDGVHSPVISGCTERIADMLFGLDEDNPPNLFVVDSGSGPPTWNSGECAWDIPVRPAARCTGLEQEYIDNIDTTVIRNTPEYLTRKYTRLYCPSGSPTTIPDRNLWSKGMDGVRPYKVDYDLCCTGVCTPTCTIGNSLFEVGDYVNLTSHRLSGYMNALGSFSGAFEIDLTLSGIPGNTLGGPFSTGCGTDSDSFCVYTFDGTGSPGAGPGGHTYGNWVVSDSGSCCACASTLPLSGLQPDGSFSWIDTEVLSIDCSGATTGCDVLTQGWEIHAKASGDQFSTPDSLDCTWGYSVKFTGCPPSSGTCAATGFAPRYISEYIPEHYFTSGTGCL